MSLREIWEMYRGRSELAWQPVSVLCCLIANVNRDPKKTKPFSPADFNPWEAGTRNHSKTKHPINKDTIAMLKVFVSN